MPNFDKCNCSDHRSVFINKIRGPVISAFTVVSTMPFVRQSEPEFAERWRERQRDVADDVWNGHVQGDLWFSIMI